MTKAHVPSLMTARIPVSLSSHRRWRYQDGTIDPASQLSRAPRKTPSSHYHTNEEQKRQTSGLGNFEYSRYVDIVFLLLVPETDFVIPHSPARGHAHPLLAREVSLQNARPAPFVTIYYCVRPPEAAFRALINAPNY
ncbi:oxidoreductase [Penicillium maclennaniae]|uniref:oxidoreductase n=1 Tax=Penicillium maclennaniae TaxID=1343394 RepID=UPI0025412C93|nr:oxidoreductase [Penicillium maclennaniae]KAJ5674342.1 oxidoreductase [Penicillium maclennaniae]